MNNATPQKFDKGWYELTDGAGAVTYTFDGAVVEVDAQGADRAGMFHFIPARGGDLVVVTVFARNLDKYSGTASIIINAASQAIQQVIAEVIDEEWAELRVELAIPLDVDIAITQIILGVTGAGQGAAQFTKPRVEIRNSNIGSSEILAKGLIQVDTGGTAFINDNFSSMGFGAITWNSGTNRIEFNLENPIAFQFIDVTGTRKFLPGIQITATGDNMSTPNVPITWGILNHDAGNGAFEVQGYNPDGTILDADTMAQASLFFHIEVKA